MNKRTETARIIERARKNVGISQLELASKIGLDCAQSISNIERGICGLPAHRVKAAARALKVNIEDLIQTHVADFAADFRNKVKGSSLLLLLSLLLGACGSGGGDAASGLASCTGNLNGVYENQVGGSPQGLVSISGCAFVYGLTQQGCELRGTYSDDRQNITLNIASRTAACGQGTTNSVTCGMTFTGQTLAIDCGSGSIQDTFIRVQ